MKYKNPDGICKPENGDLAITFKGVKDGIIEVADRINKPKVPYSVEELKEMLSCNTQYT